MAVPVRLRILARAGRGETFRSHAGKLERGPSDRGVDHADPPMLAPFDIACASVRGKPQLGEV